MEKLNLKEFAFGIFDGVDSVVAIIMGNGDVLFTIRGKSAILRLSIDISKLGRYLPPALLGSSGKLGFVSYNLAPNDFMFLRFIGMSDFFEVVEND